MRIGIFTDSFTPVANGVSVSVNMLYQGLKELGHEVFIIATEHKEPQEFDPHIIRLQGFNVPLDSFEGFQLVPGINKYYEIIKEMNLDVIHVHTEFSVGRFGIRCARKFHIPYVYTMHTMYEEYMHHVVKYGKIVLKRPFVAYVKAMIRWFCKDASAIILPHEKVREMFERYDIKTRIHIVPTGLNLDHFNPANYTKEEVLGLKEKLGLHDEFIMLYIGRLAGEKSIDLLISEFAKFSNDVNAKMVIVGPGPIMDKLVALTNELNMSEKIIFTGAVSWSEIGLYYQLGDCFINASITETQGLTYIEALSAGLPVIVRYDTNLDGLVKDEYNGLFYREKEEFEKQIKRIVSDSDLRSSLKNNARPSVMHYSKENYAASLEKIYEEVIYEKSGTNSKK